MPIGDTTYHSLEANESPFSRTHAAALPPCPGLQVGNSERINTDTGNGRGTIQGQDVTAIIVPAGDLRVLVTPESAPTITLDNSRKLVTGVPNNVFVKKDSRVVLGAPAS